MTSSRNCKPAITRRTVEKRYLQRVHGPTCQQYAARVGRFLPGIGQLPSEVGTR